MSKHNPIPIFHASTFFSLATCFHVSFTHTNILHSACTATHTRVHIFPSMYNTQTENPTLEPKTINLSRKNVHSIFNFIKHHEEINSTLSLNLTHIKTLITPQSNITKKTGQSPWNSNSFLSPLPIWPTGEKSAGVSVSLTGIRAYCATGDTTDP